ncbi:MAG: glycosyltransferase family 2 protein [Candidatus Pacebacteria bacterium]|nr:glycosyltransferase family 2 protein [Candidatus Paceibacterota bacterium]
MKSELEICIPTYKRPKELRECLESIIAQDEFHSGWVTVRIYDDAPQDPSYEAIKDIINLYPKQIVYRKNIKNLKTEENISQLLENSKSTYSLFITDDDSFTKNSLQRLRRLFTTHPHLTVVRSSFAIVRDMKDYRTHTLFSRDTQISQNDISTVARFFRDSDTLSGTCFLRATQDIAGYRRHKSSKYPHMYLVGKSALSGDSYYFSNPLIQHAVGNAVFWEYTRDYMISGIFAMVQDLDILKPGFFTQAARLVFSSVPYIVFINLLHPKRLTQFLLVMIEKKYFILSVFWEGCALGVYQLVREKLSQMKN